MAMLRHLLNLIKNFSPRRVWLGVFLLSALGLVLMSGFLPGAALLASPVQPNLTGQNAPAQDYLLAEEQDVAATLANLKEQYRVTDKKLMVAGLVLLGFTILCFALHGLLNMQVSVAALTGSLLLVAIARVDNSFIDYLKACWWPMMITVTICMFYLLIFY